MLLETSLRITNLSLLFLICYVNVNYSEPEQCFISDEKNVETCGKIKYYSNIKYILYDVNPAEGFNLRRDVYIRISNFIKHIIEVEKEYQWYLVLPPWGPLYHWQSSDISSQKQLPWGTFFDISSLKKYVPVIEMYQFLQEYSSIRNKTMIDITYILQNDEEMFKTGKFREKNEIVNCPVSKIKYQKLTTQEYYGDFWGYNNITSKTVKCVVFQGSVFKLKRNLYPSKYRSIKFDHMEIPLHDSYGSIDYWTARRSMRYNKELYQIANEFRMKYLNSNNIDDKTERPTDWREEKGRRNALGGPYVSVHLRRKDFLYGHSDSIPSIKNAALQLQKILDKLKLKTLFVATDTNDNEYEELQNHLSNYIVLRYKPTTYVKHKFKDGGIAILDQIICSYSRYFVGTKESTFTFRIQEDREIIGFPVNTTFNFLCAKEKCVFNNRWEIVW